MPHPRARAMTLDTYVPAVRQRQIGDKTVSIAPLKVRQIPAFARALAPAARELAAGDLGAALLGHGEALIDALAVATGAPVEWLGALEADEFLALAADVVEVNADFFTHRTAPALEQALARVTAALAPATAGATLSSASPAPASATPAHSS